MPTMNKGCDENSGTAMAAKEEAEKQGTASRGLALLNHPDSASHPASLQENAKKTICCKILISPLLKA